MEASRASKVEAGKSSTDGMLQTVSSGTFSENKHGMLLHLMQTQNPKQLARIGFLRRCNVVNFGWIKVNRNKVVSVFVELAFDSQEFAPGDSHDFFADFRRHQCGNRENCSRRITRVFDECGGLREKANQKEDKIVSARHQTTGERSSQSTQEVNTYHTRFLVGQRIVFTDRGMVNSEAHSRCRDDRRAKCQELVFLEHSFHVVVCSKLHRRGSIGDEEESLCKGVSGRDGDLEDQLGQNVVFHVEHLLAGKAAVGDIDAVTHLRRVDLLILGGDEESRDSNELEPGAFNIDKAEIAVENVDAKVQCLGDEAKFHVDFDEPVNKNGSHCNSQTCLSMHIW
jgi:hypothetical protein